MTATGCRPLGRWTPPRLSSASSAGGLGWRWVVRQSAWREVGMQGNHSCMPSAYWCGVSVKLKAPHGCTALNAAL